MKANSVLRKPRDEDTKRKISESAKSSPLVAEAQRKATEATAEVTRGQERPVEVRNKIGISHRKPDYTEMQDFFYRFPQTCTCPKRLACFVKSFQP